MRQSRNPYCRVCFEDSEGMPESERRIEMDKYVIHREGKKKEKYFKCPVCHNTFKDRELKTPLNP